YRPATKSSRSRAAREFSRRWLGSPRAGAFSTIGRGSCVAGHHVAGPRAGETSAARRRRSAANHPFRRRLSASSVGRARHATPIMSGLAELRLRGGVPQMNRPGVMLISMLPEIRNLGMLYLAESVRAAGHDAGLLFMTNMRAKDRGGIAF